MLFKAKLCTGEQIETDDTTSLQNLSNLNETKQIRTCYGEIRSLWSQHSLAGNVLASVWGNAISDNWNLQSTNVYIHTYIHT